MMFSRNYNTKMFSRRLNLKGIVICLTLTYADAFVSWIFFPDNA